MHHVGCYRYHNLGRRCFTRHASINGESKCGSGGRRIVESWGGWGGRNYIANEICSQKTTRVLFCQNCNWLVNLILLFTSYIQILLFLHRMLLGRIILWYFLLMETSNAINLEHYGEHSVCTECFLYSDSHTGYTRVTITLTIPLLYFLFCWNLRVPMSIDTTLSTLPLWTSNSASIVTCLCSD
jgi:hypothetical protein